MNFNHHSPRFLGPLLGGRRGVPVARWTALAFCVLAGVAFLIRFNGNLTIPMPPGTPIPAVEFSRLVRDFSEPDGFFRSDNFVSNETSYLHVIPLLREKGISGGVYLGVGPEQNFTYIAKIRPELAFIVDIRRQAVLQHLLYKALFRLSDSRREFLAMLISRPAEGPTAPREDADLPALVRYFSTRPADPDFYERNLARILDYLTKECLIPLSPMDIRGIQFVFASFRDGGLGIRYRVGRVIDAGSANMPYWGGMFPSLSEILTGEDLEGRMENFLASNEDFRFVQGLQRRNRIIPVVGDFAGNKSLRAVSSYLNERGLLVSAFYVSNVEQYLFQYNAFDRFMDNVKSLPFAATSVFIRAVAARRYQHPANIPGHRLTTILQTPQSLLEAYEHGDVSSYWELVTRDYLAIRPKPATQP